MNRLLPLLALLFALPASGQVFGKVILADTGVTNTFAAGDTTTNLGAAINLDRGVDNKVTLVARLQGSSAGTSNVVFTFLYSVDATGSSYATTPTLTWTVPLNGTTEVLAITNLAAGAVGGVKYIKLSNVANGDNTSVTNAYVKALCKREK